MANNVLSSVAETLGPVAAAKRALSGKTWTPEAEAIFIAHWRDFDAGLLLAWLAHEPAADMARPSRGIVERIVEAMPHDAGALFFLGYEHAIAGVTDAEVRDAIVEKLRAHLNDTIWARLTVSATGGAVFGAVRDCELRHWNNEAHPPFEAFVEGQVPCSLIDILFEKRREDAACLQMLLERVRDPKTRIYVLWVLRETKLLGRV